MEDLLPFDVIVSNPPYIPSGQIPTLDKSVKDFEPIIALDGGLDGLDFHRRILAEAPARMVPGGRIFLEIAFDQGEQVLSNWRVSDSRTRRCPRLLKDAGGGNG